MRDNRGIQREVTTIIIVVIIAIIVITMTTKANPQGPETLTELGSERYQGSAPIGVDAQFKGQVRLDGRIIRELESDIISVGAGIQQPLEMLFQPPSEGRYVISGRVLYNRKITSDRESILNVRSGQSDISLLWIAIIIFGYIFALALAIYLIILFRKKSSRAR